MPSNFEVRQYERRRAANASRPKPARDVARAQHLGRSVYESVYEDEARYEEEPADPEEGVVWTPLARYRPFGRKLGD